MSANMTPGFHYASCFQEGKGENEHFFVLISFTKF